MSVVDKKQQAAGVCCPRCDCPESRVIQTRKRVITINGEKAGGIRRERECDYCGKRFWTTEAMS